MASSTRPLSAEEWTTLVEFGPSYVKPFCAYNDFDPVHVALWIGRTGMHPVVLAEPVSHNLELRETPKGLSAVWDRPKKKGLDARTEVPLVDPLVLPWAREFVAEIRAKPPTLSSIGRSLRDLGRQAGLNYLGPRCLRHTFLRWVADTGDPTAVKVLGNVSGRVAMVYVERAMVEEYRDSLRALIQIPSGPGLLSPEGNHQPERVSA